MSKAKKEFRILAIEKFSSNEKFFAKDNIHLKFEYQSEINTLSATNKNVDALVIRSKTKIDSKLLSFFSNLKLIITCTSGYDHIDLASCSENNVAVFYTPESNADSAAELTWTLLLSQTKNLIQNTSNANTLKWRQENLRSQVLHNKTLGIVGLGRIGSRVARYAIAFGMNVIYYDPYVLHQNSMLTKNLKLTQVSFDYLITNSDFVTFHVPRTSETNQMLNANTTQLLKTHCSIINTSRASVFNCEAVFNFLKANPKSRLCLDVHDNEPLQNDYLYLNHPQTLLTPHIGAQTQEALENSSKEALEKLFLFFSGQKVTDQLA